MNKKLALHDEVEFIRMVDAWPYALIRVGDRGFVFRTHPSGAVDVRLDQNHPGLAMRHNCIRVNDPNKTVRFVEPVVTSGAILKSFLARFAAVYGPVPAAITAMYPATAFAAEMIPDPNSIIVVLLQVLVALSLIG